MFLTLPISFIVAIYFDWSLDEEPGDRIILKNFKYVYSYRTLLQCMRYVLNEQDVQKEMC